MRRWREEDREPYAALNADPRGMRYFPALMDRAASDASVDLIEERFVARGFGLWALERLDTRGFATVAARAASRIAFEELGLPQLWSMTAILNEPSQAVMRRIGMTPHARFDHPRVPEGHPVRPHVVYRLRSAGSSSW